MDFSAVCHVLLYIHELYKKATIEKNYLVAN